MHRSQKTKTRPTNTKPTVRHDLHEIHRSQNWSFIHLNLKDNKIIKQESHSMYASPFWDIKNQSQTTNTGSFLHYWPRIHTKLWVTLSTCQHFLVHQSEIAGKKNHRPHKMGLFSLAMKWHKQFWVHSVHASTFWDIKLILMKLIHRPHKPSAKTDQ